MKFKKKMKLKVSFKSLKDTKFSSTFPDVIYKSRKNILRVKVLKKYRGNRIVLNLRTIDFKKEKKKSVEVFSTEYEEEKEYIVFKYKVSFGLISFKYNRSKIVLDVELVGESSKRVVFTSNPFMVLSKVRDDDVFFKRRKTSSEEEESSSDEEESSSDEEEENITGNKRKRKVEMEDIPETKKQKTLDN